VLVEPIAISVIDGVVAIAGDLDAQSAPALDLVLGANDEAIRLDLSQVTFMDSAGVNVLVHHRRRQIEHGSAVQIVAMSRCVRRVLEITGLLALFSGEASLAS
jgi:anti-sigma B factor antagonist